ncbi:MAG: helix-turn-helix domain-containing protein [Stigonema ocellatum SAG 48.90 = DSM 106950]|nr:helix-turn-helix domain-containing protein [Stigonema ocellatum SAG 48.90 = DSM 106950]
MTLLNEAQEEQLKEIVAHIRQVREEKSILIEEIAAHTRIRPAFILALEEGRFEVLPEPIYVQGFIRRYGDAVGLDGAALAQTFATTFSEPKSAEYQENLDKKPNIHIPLVVPYILLLAAAIFGLFYILNPRRTTDSHAQNQISPLASKQKKVSTRASSVKQAISTKKTVPTPVASLLRASTPTPTISPTTDTNKAVEVALDLQDKSWLQVKVDGKIAFEGTLDKGERKTWTAKKELTIRAGNAGAVLVSENKKEPKSLGPFGGVKQVTFTSH